MWRGCIIRLLSVIALYENSVCNGVEIPQVPRYASLQDLPELFRTLMEAYEHADTYVIGQTDQGDDIPVLMVTRNARERNFSLRPNICLIGGVFKLDRTSKEIVLDFAIRTMQGETALFATIQSQFVLHVLVTAYYKMDTEETPQDTFFTFPKVFADVSENDTLHVAKTIMSWLQRTRCLLTVIFRGYGRGVEIPFYSDAHNVSAFLASGHVLLHRLHDEIAVNNTKTSRQSKGKVKILFKDEGEEEDYEDTEEASSMGPDAVTAMILKALQTNRTRRSEPSRWSDDYRAQNKTAQRHSGSSHNTGDAYKPGRRDTGFPAHVGHKFERDGRRENVRAKPEQRVRDSVGKSASREVAGEKAKRSVETMFGSARDADFWSREGRVLLDNANVGMEGGRTIDMPQASSSGTSGDEFRDTSALADTNVRALWNDAGVPFDTPDSLPNSDEPDQSQNQDAPDQSQNQDAPDQSQNQDAPDQSQNQDAPDQSQNQDAPDQSQNQDAPDESQNQDAPDQSQNQDESDESQTPDDDNSKDKCLPDTRPKPLPEFLAPDHDSLMYLATKFADNLQNIHYPNCHTKTYISCPPENVTVFTGRSWYYAAGGLADYVYLTTGSLPLSVFGFCMSDVASADKMRELVNLFWEPLSTTVLATRYGVRGIVRNVEGIPLANVSYTVLGREQIVQTTNDKGEYYRLLVDGHTLKFWKEDYKPLLLPVQLVKDEISVINVTLREPWDTDDLPYLDTTELNGRPASAIISCTSLCLALLSSFIVISVQPAHN